MKSPDRPNQIALSLDTSLLPSNRTSGSLARLTDRNKDFGFVSELVEAIGAEGTLALLLTHGGTRIFVPAKMPENHPFAKLLGHDAAIALSRQFTGLDIELPLGHRVKLHRDVDELKVRLEAGASTSDLAKEFGVTMRTIWRMIAKYGFVRLNFAQMLEFFGLEGTLGFVHAYSRQFATVPVPLAKSSEIAGIVGTEGARNLSDFLFEKHGKGKLHVKPEETASQQASKVAQIWYLAWLGNDEVTIAEKTGASSALVFDSFDSFAELKGRYRPVTLALFAAMSAPDAPVAD